MLQVGMPACLKGNASIPDKAARPLKHALLQAQKTVRMHACLACSECAGIP